MSIAPTPRRVTTTDDPVLARLMANPYPIYEQLRLAGSINWLDEIGAWSVARYPDVGDLLTDPRFSAQRSEDVGMGPATPASIVPPGTLSMLASDPPDHTRLRTLVQKAFTPRRIESLRPRIQTLVDDLLDRAAGQPGPVDLISEFAYPLPVMVIAELLGVPPEDRADFRAWSNAAAASLDMLLPPGRIEQAVTAYGELHMYLRAVIDRRRIEPRDDLISDLVAVEEQGDTLTEAELIVMCTLLLIAGHETTVNLIGNGSLALLRHPDQLDRLRAEPHLLSTAIEELLRFDAPVQMTARIARDDLQLGSEHIRGGDWVLALLGSANHDPAVFTDPQQLDLGRSPNPHLAFGRGIHYCLGAPLARMEGQIAIGSLVGRFADIHLAGEPVRRPTITLRGLQTLPVGGLSYP
jgi:cytochrome P450